MLPRLPYKHKFTAFVILLIFFLAFVSYYYLKAKTTYYKDSVSVLIYHHIDDQGNGGDTITSSLFKKDLEYLKKEGFSFVSHQQFKSFLTGSPVPDNAVLVTFDDAYESYYKQAYPILKELSVPSVQFVITDKLLHPNEGITPYLSREEILDMTKTGDFVEVQSHSHNLHFKQNNEAALTNLLDINGQKETIQDFEQRVVSDLQTSVSMLTPLQAYPVDSLAYPFGIYSESVIQLAKQAGVQFAYTVQPGIADRNSDTYQIPRINAGSPWITPANLVQRIKVQKKQFKEPLDELPLRGVIEQIGGTVESNGKGKQFSIYFAHQKWILSSKTAVNPDNGQTVTLTKGIINKSGVSYISYSDLQPIFGKMTIQYDKKKKRFYPDPTLSPE